MVVELVLGDDDAGVCAGQGEGVVDAAAGEAALAPLGDLLVVVGEGSQDLLGEFLHLSAAGRLGGPGVAVPVEPAGAVCDVAGAVSEGVDEEECVGVFGAVPQGSGLAVGVDVDDFGEVAVRGRGLWGGVGGEVDDDAAVGAFPVPLAVEFACGGVVVTLVVEDGEGPGLGVRDFRFELGAGGEDVEAVAFGVFPCGRGGAVGGVLAGPGPVGGVAFLVVDGPPVGGEDVRPCCAGFVVVVGGQAGARRGRQAPRRFVPGTPVHLRGCGCGHFVEGAEHIQEGCHLHAGEGGGGGWASEDPDPGLACRVAGAGGGGGDGESAFPAGLGEHGDPLPRVGFLLGFGGGAAGELLIAVGGVLCADVEVPAARWAGLGPALDGAGPQVADATVLGEFPEGGELVDGAAFDLNEGEVAADCSADHAEPPVGVFGEPLVDL